MKPFRADFTFTFEGGLADSNKLEFYDAAQAMLGFQRSLALTTHLLLNNEVIVQAPSLRGAEVVATVPEAGSWKITAAVIAGIGSLSVAPKDTPVGHLMWSGYDYMLKRSLGVDVSYDETIRISIERAKAEGAGIPDLDETRFDSLIEKTEGAVKAMHRPTIGSLTANSGIVSAQKNGVRIILGAPLDQNSYLFVKDSLEDSFVTELDGRVSGYNTNTFRGRIFLSDYGRPIPFELSPNARGVSERALILNSMVENDRNRSGEKGLITVTVRKVEANNGRLKKVIIEKAEATQDLQ